MVLLIQMPLPASAADWTRLQRLRGAKTYTAQNKDILNKVTAGNPFHPETQQSRVVGSSRIRRETSKWTDFVASQRETFISQTTTAKGTQRSITKLCKCQTSVLTTKATGCIKCKYM